MTCRVKGCGQPAPYYIHLDLTHLTPTFEVREIPQCPRHAAEMERNFRDMESRPPYERFSLRTYAESL